MNTLRGGIAAHVLFPALAVILVAGFVRVAEPGWTERAGLDVWNLPALREELRSNDERWADLDQQTHRLRREIDLSLAVASQLIDGTATLEAAVGELEPVLATRPGFELVWRNPGSPCYAPTFRKAVGRYAIGKASDLLDGDASRWPQVSARLAAEYAALE
jgi:hypothetical protein